MSDLLTKGFQNVDRASDPARYAEFLGRIYSRPFTKEYKAAVLRHLTLEPGQVVLDIGCGIGIDAGLMAEVVQPGGCCIGIDCSERLIAEARAKQGNDGVGLKFEVALAESLPFPSAFFDRIRVDRVLQHMANPTGALGELARVLKPGGLAVIYDNDWTHFRILPGERTISDAIAQAWISSVAQPQIVQGLPSILENVGLVVRRKEEFLSTTTALKDASELYELMKLKEHAASGGTFTSEELEGWVSSLKKAERAKEIITQLPAALFEVAKVEGGQ